MFRTAYSKFYALLRLVPNLMVQYLHRNQCITENIN